MPTDFETAVLAQSPVVNLDGNQDGVTKNTDSDGSFTGQLADEGTVGAPGVGPTGAGDVSYNFDAAGYWDANTLPAPLSDDTSGTILVSFKVAALDPAATQYLFATGRRNSGAQVMTLIINSAGALSFFIVKNGFSSNDYFINDDALTSVVDDTWHFAVVRQKADGSTGLEMYLDGSWLSVTGTTNGTGDIDDWFSTFDLAVIIDAFRIGRSSATTSTQIADGEMSHCSIWSTALSDAVIDSLYEEWLGGPQFDSKTIRRKGRRLFFDYSTL